jgi:hypothetical protein
MASRSCGLSWLLLSLASALLVAHSVSENDRKVDISVANVLILFMESVLLITQFIQGRISLKLTPFFFSLIYLFFMWDDLILIDFIFYQWYCARRLILCIWATGRWTRFPHHPFTQACYKTSLAGSKTRAMKPLETCYLIYA